MTVGQRIKDRRKVLGLTQEELGKRLGYTKSAICKIETDKEQNLTTDRLSLIANALECSEALLMGWEDVPHIKEVTEDMVMMEQYNKLSDANKKFVRDFIAKLYMSENI